MLNDEGHHCWRPNPAGPSEEALSAVTKEERDRLEEDKEEARVWLSGLDRINNCGLVGHDEAGGPRAGILACIDLSATPFYLGNSGYPEGSPFPWLVSDFGLVDAIECGIVKIPRLLVADDKAGTDEAGRPDPKYFRLWHHITARLQPNEKIAKRPKPDAIYRHAESALKTLAAQWKIRFDQIKKDSPAGDFIPPVMIVVCDNTDIADVFFQRISGERPLDGADDSDEGIQVEKVVYSDSDIFPELQNEPGLKRTVRIDTKLLAKIETEEGETKDEAAKALRDVIASIGKRGGPGEQVRCIVSVSMLTEGWDANNVTHVLGVRAFLSQLLCEQVVGRGLRRMNYNVDPKDGASAGRIRGCVRDSVLPDPLQRPTAGGQAGRPGVSPHLQRGGAGFIRDSLPSCRKLHVRRARQRDPMRHRHAGRARGHGGADHRLADADARLQRRPGGVGCR